MWYSRPTQSPLTSACGVLSSLTASDDSGGIVTWQRMTVCGLQKQSQCQASLSHNLASRAHLEDLCIDSIDGREPHPVTLIAVGVLAERAAPFVVWIFIDGNHQHGKPGSRHSKLSPLVHPYTRFLHSLGMSESGTSLVEKKVDTKLDAALDDPAERSEVVVDDVVE